MAYCQVQRFCSADDLKTPFVPPQGLRIRLEATYNRWNRREFVHPDPLEFLYDYPDVNEREIVALVASSLAYGKVKQILRSVSMVLQRVGPSPRAFILESRLPCLRRTFSDFRHRFTSGEELVSMLMGVKGVLEKYGSLRGCFRSHLKGRDTTVLPALCAFVEELSLGSDGKKCILLASPSGASACKKLNLFLRWMVRHDEVDPGGWEEVSPSKLIVPLDTHMHKVGLRLGMTRRRQADMRAALEITAGFRTMVPDDPVRYDFVLTRPGIWGDPEMVLG